MYNERMNKMLASQWPAVCAYLNKCEDEGSGGWKEEKILEYCNANYPDEDIVWFTDDQNEGEELMALLKGTDNGHAFNTVIIHDWLQIPAEYLKEFRQAILDARIEVKEVLRPAPRNK